MTEQDHIKRAAPAQSQDRIKEYELSRWYELRQEKLAAEKQLRKRVDRLNKAYQYLSRVLYPMREELTKLENSRLALERLIFETEGKVKKCSTRKQNSREQNSHKQAKPTKSKESEAAKVLSKLNKSELERLLAQVQKQEQEQAKASGAGEARKED